MPVFQLKKNIYTFPHASQANKNGLLAIGGDLCAERLINAYANGIFPWSESDDTIFWWSPDPRMVLFPEDFKISKSLNQKIKSGKFTVKFDLQFEEVIERCARTPRKHEDSTWITAEMKKAYINLHQLGIAHSVETYVNNELVGGLYGVSLGNAFFGESMFHTKTDASKAAFAALIEFSKKNNIAFIDCQMYTNHLESLGAKEMPRSIFLQLLEKFVYQKTIVGNWNDYLKQQNKPE